MRRVADLATNAVQTPCQADLEKRAGTSPRREQPMHRAVGKGEGRRVYPVAAARLANLD